MRKHLLTTILLVLCSLSVHAASKPAQKLNYKTYWYTSKKSVSQIGDAQVTTQVSQRMLPVRGTLIPVATMTTGEIKSATGEGFPKDFAGALAQLTKIKKWKQENRGSYMAYEAPLPDQGRILKVFISKDKDTYKYSIATVRVSFMLPTYFEVELQQREQIGDLKGIAALQRSNDKFASYYRMLMQPAQASATGDWIVNYLSNWQTTANNAVGSVNNLADAGKGIAVAGNNISVAGNNISSSINGIGGKLDTVANVFSTQSDKVVASIDKGVNAVEGFQNAGKMAKVAAAAGLGGALGYGLGTVLVQFATDGAAKITHELYYMITGDLKPELRQRITDRGQKAWNSLEALSKKAMELDVEMQLQMSAMFLAGGKDPMSLADAEREMDLLQDKIHDAEELKKTNQDDNFRNQCNIKIRQMREQLELLKNVAPILRKNRSSASMCAAFDQMYDRWVDIEGEITQARSIVMNDTFALIRDADNRQQDAAKNYASPRNQKKECNFKTSIDMAQSEISKNSCICDGAVYSGACGSLCRTLSNYQESSRVCEAAGARANDVDPVAEMEERSRIALQTAKSLERRQNQIVSGTGNFGKTQQLMTTHFRDILDQCGIKTAVNVPGAEARGKQMANALMSSDAPISSAAPANVPNKSQSRGFFAGIWDALAAPFKWFTGS